MTKDQEPLTNQLACSARVGAICDCLPWFQKAEGAWKGRIAQRCTVRLPSAVSPLQGAVRLDGAGGFFQGCTGFARLRFALLSCPFGAGEGREPLTVVYSCLRLFGRGGNPGQSEWIQPCARLAGLREMAVFKERQTHVGRYDGGSESIRPDPTLVGERQDGGRRRCSESGRLTPAATMRVPSQSDLIRPV
jgi:hypothetical protein